MTRPGLRDVSNVQKSTSLKRARVDVKGPNPSKAEQCQTRPNQNGCPNALLINAKVLKIVLPTPAEKLEQQLNPQEASEYSEAVRKYLHVRETNSDLRVSNPLYLDRQPEISPRMRGILLDWLVEVHYKFKLMPETLYLCINLIDRFLEKDATTSRKKLQLVGGTSLLLASKYEEFRPPEVGDICYIMDNAYTRDEILEMEVKILNTLKFQVTVPSGLQFLEFLIGAMGIPREHDHFYLAQYLIESTLLDLRFLKYKPSELAAASLYLANRIKKLPAPWPDQLKQLTNLEEVSLVKPLAKEIFEQIPNLRNKSLFKKYSMEKYKSVAPTIPSQ